MFQATAAFDDIDSNNGVREAWWMQGILIWLPPVACCMAIQGLWLGVLQVLQPRIPQRDLQNLHRFSPGDAPTLNTSLFRSHG